MKRERGRSALPVPGGGSTSPPGRAASTPGAIVPQPTPPVSGTTLACWVPPFPTGRFLAILAFALLVLSACATAGKQPAVVSTIRPGASPPPAARPAVPDSLARQLAGTWRMVALSTGKPDLDRELASDLSLRYRFAPNGSGQYLNQAGSHEFFWESPPAAGTKVRGLAIRFRMEYLELYDSLEFRDRGRTLVLHGSFDMDFDNHPETVSLTLSRLD